MTQTWAIVVDAYRELNARKLFWVTLVLSVLVVAVIASLGISTKGPTILGFEFPFPIINSTIIEPADFYKAIFVGVGYTIWLSWAATILALISTASIIPDFISSGSIELSLSKPIGRARLFLTKYATGVLFVTLQVGLFSLLSFLVIGIRGSSWEWGIFWSIPLIVVFFSYLFCIAALVGLLTRSAITSLLLTGVLWFLIFALHGAESGWLLGSMAQNRLAIDLHESEIKSRQTLLVQARAEAGQGTPATPAADPVKEGEGAPPAPWPTMEDLADPLAQRRAAVAKLESEIADYTEKLQQVRDELQTQQRYHAMLYVAKTILPKTTETTDLLGRVLLTGSEFDRVADQAEAEAERRGRRMPTTRVGNVRVSDRLIGKEVDKVLRARSTLWVIGTSLGFEAVILGITCLIFTRRDF